MATTEPLRPIVDVITQSLDIRHLYGEPVRQGDTIVIPVAQVAFGFGGGGGSARPKPRAVPETEEGGRPEAFGSGGGGAVRMTPLGVLEIGPDETRFVRFRPLAPWLAAAALGLAAGWWLGRRR